MPDQVWYGHIIVCVLLNMGLHNSELDQRIADVSPVQKSLGEHLFPYA